MEILVDAPVVCSDGAAGHVSALIMNPLSNELTHMVVRQTGLLGIERLVPVTFILEATPEEIVLNCTLAELAEQPPFVVYELIQGPSYVDVELPDTPLNWLGNGSEDEERIPISYENLPQGEIALHHGAGVHASDGQVGRVDELAVGSDGKIAYLVLREDHLWGQKDITVPVAQIDRASEDAVYLKLTKREIAALPTVLIQHQHAANPPITP